MGIFAEITPGTPEAAIDTAAESLKDSLVNVGTAVLPYAAGVLVLTIGWRFARKFVRG